MFMVAYFGVSGQNFALFLINDINCEVVIFSNLRPKNFTLTRQRTHELGDSPGAEDAPHEGQLGPAERHLGSGGDEEEEKLSQHSGFPAGPGERNEISNFLVHSLLQLLLLSLSYDAFFSGFLCMQFK